MTLDGTVLARVLYVEDDANLRYTLGKMLEYLDYKVECAVNGKAGVEKAESWNPDVILLDIRMPVMDGIEALQTIRNNPATAKIPIFMLSAFTDAKTRRACQQADGFFSKPPNYQRIDSAIKKVLKIQDS